MSAKIKLYNLVKTAVLAIPEIEHFSHFNNQFDTEEDEQVFNYPVVFFEFSDLPWLPSSQAGFNPQGTQEQKSESVQFTLHIGYWSHEEEEDIFLGLLDIVDKVYRAIANIEGDEINPIQRISESDDNTHKQVVVWQTTFNTMLTECGVNKNVQGVNVTPVVVTSNT